MDKNNCILKVRKLFMNDFKFYFFNRLRYVICKNKTLNYHKQKVSLLLFFNADTIKQG